MRLLFFALLGLNAAAALLQLTVWQAPEVRDTDPSEAARVPDAPRLQRLSEADKARHPPKARPQASSGSERSLCLLVGPFPELLRAEYFVEHLAALEVDGEITRLDVPEGKGYWVHLPPEPSRSQALERLRQVQAEDIDSYLIPRGDLANGISLGMFTRETLASDRLEAMRERGYPAQIREITRTREEIWVRVDRQDGRNLGDEAWVKLLDREEGIEKQQNYCQGVASG